ncbi:hypothetical protein DUNSADRAFT_14544 [Dunaliella salina]|uniref:Uncharacterized protein n=1 Tax=Dunaliella salina TaxID=3046 RepID=A0ABQ7G796_DUNSA|nr:hypothetical protein DUNSADRAFT_14544 [Dunaliella salina]|eukprot:KAF5830463.1 hypothetical protein DUNSADRAFT_14544 [Dunaliella salina]
MTRLALLAIAGLLSFCVAPSFAAVTDGKTKYSDIAVWGAGNQFDIVLKVGKIPSGEITDPLQDVKDLSTCTNLDYRKGEYSEDACNAPPIKDNSADVIQVVASLADSSPSAALQCQVQGDEFSEDNRTPTKSSTPNKIEARMCYSKVAYDERPWRKKNKPYPSLSLNCPWLVEKVDIDSKNADGQWVMTKFFDDFDEVPSATYFIMVHALTDVDGDSTVCAFSSTEEKAYLMTEVDMGRTPGVIAAATVFSIFSIVFLVVYTAADTIWYNKTGKGLTFGVA